MLDLDGVLWRGKTPIPGSAEAVARVRAAGHRVGFLTNNSFTAVACAAGVQAGIAGKPNPAAARLLAERMGEITWLVGDRLDTDGAMATAVGARFGLVLSGVTTSADGADPKPEAVAPDLAAL